MAKELWCIAEANKIIKKYGTKETIIFETGYGPSGLPHIGTFAEVARTLYVIDAIRFLEPNLKTKLIVFSDDMDGLRKAPDTIPNKENIVQYLGTPLCDIPDPFAKKGSFSGYMNDQLQQFLDQFGFEYQFKSSAESYRSGEFDEGLKKVFLHREKIKEVFVQSIAKEKRANWEPFFVICEQCGKINTTRVTNYYEDDFSVDYVCDHNADIYSCCGHQGRRSVLKGASKVGWKVDWALRWHVFKIAFEMHGEDLTDSAKMSTALCKILGKDFPITYKYELFLDEAGKKISKKIGNGLSMEQWLCFAPTPALAYFLTSNPNKTKKMGLPILPKIVDEYLQAIRQTEIHAGTDALWYIRELNKHSIEYLSPKLTYILLTNLADSLSIEDANLLYEYALNYDQSIDKNKQFYLQLCEKVILYLKELKSNFPQETVQPSTKYLFLLDRIKEVLQKQNQQFEGSDMQTELFTISKENEIPIKDWFQFLYQAILNKNEGPKMGYFFAIMGKEKSIQLIDTAIQQNKV